MLQAASLRLPHRPRRCVTAPAAREHGADSGRRRIRARSVVRSPASRVRCSSRVRVCGCRASAALGATDCLARLTRAAPVRVRALPRPRADGVDPLAGPCAPGWLCPAGSWNATAQSCGAGSYCPTGSGSPILCPAGSIPVACRVLLMLTTVLSSGRWGSALNAATASCSGACRAGRYGAASGQTSDDCTVCNLS